jgi:hypothetical protein
LIIAALTDAFSAHGVMRRYVSEFARITGQAEAFVIARQSAWP